MINFLIWINTVLFGTISLRNAQRYDHNRKPALHLKEADM